MNCSANVKFSRIHGDCVLQGIEPAIKMPMHQKTDIDIFKFRATKNTNIPIHRHTEIHIAHIL